MQLNRLLTKNEKMFWTNQILILHILRILATMRGPLASVTQIYQARVPGLWKSSIIGDPLLNWYLAFLTRPCCRIKNDQSFQLTSPKFWSALAPAPASGASRTSRSWTCPPTRPAAKTCQTFHKSRSDRSEVSCPGERKLFIQLFTAF